MKSASPGYAEFLSEDRDRPGLLYFGGARMALLDIEAGFWGLRRQIEALVGPRLTDVVLQQAGVNGGASFARAFAGETSPGDVPETLRACIAAYQAAGFGRFEIETLEWPIGRLVVRAWDTFESWAMRRSGQASERPACAYSAGVLVGFVNALSGRHDVVCAKRTCQAQGAQSCLFELLPATDAGDVPVIAFAPDPALGRRLNLLEILFDRMPMGIVILDRDLRVRRFNPTWASFIERYSQVPSSQVVSGASMFDLITADRATFEPVLRRVLDGHTVHQEAFCLETQGGVSYWDAVLTPLVDEGKVVGIVHVTTDVTPRVQAQQDLQSAYHTLERRVQERTRELSTLLEISQNVTSTLELEPLLGLILDELKNVMDYDGSTILTVEGAHLLVRAYRGPMSQEAVSQVRFPRDGPLDRRVLLGRKPVIVPDVQDDTPLARAYRASAGDGLRTAFGSWMGVPLVVKNRVIGELALGHGQPGYFTPQRADLALTFASQVAVAIENARLYEEEQERLEESERRRQVAEGLRDILAVLNSDRPPDEILNYIVAQACQLLGSDLSTLHHIEHDRQFVTIEAAYGLPAELQHIEGFPLHSGKADQAILDRRPFFESFPAPQPAPPAGDEALDPRVRLWRKVTIERYPAFLAVPLVVRDEVYGSIVFYYAQPRAFSDEEVNLAVTFADQAALAIENARLRVQAEQAAVMQERNRLARELHDSVSQALYGIALGTRTARKLLEREPVNQEVQASLSRPLDYVLSLADSGLAEMRALIFELRPDALEKQGLVAALERQITAFQARHKLETQTALCQEPELPLPAKQALYRIAQEALNNVVKHAQATRVEIRLEEQAGAVALAVQDDGVGFDPQGEFRGHLGLQSMRERAERLGGRVDINSAPGRGTLLRAVIPTPQSLAAQNSATQVSPSATGTLL